MSDTDEQTDLDAARSHMWQERCYTLGWRAYLDGRPEPRYEISAAGWRDAKHARESCDREILWSLDIKYITPSSI